MFGDSPIRNFAALVTGASRGIGEAIALRLAREGVKVVVSARSHDDLEHLVNRIQDEGGAACAISCDLSQSDQVHALARQATAPFGRLDILINNAGLGLKKPYYESSDAEWNFLMNVNALAPFIICRECLPELRKSNCAAIINIGSVVGIKGYEKQALYAASKHALMGFTKVLAQEVQPFGIRVHAINPGGVNTEMAHLMRPDLDASGLIQPQDVAEIVLFLLLHRNNAVIDDIHIRRANGSPWY